MRGHLNGLLKHLQRSHALDSFLTFFSLSLNLKQFDNLASLPFAYMFYISTIILRVCIILGREFAHRTFKYYNEEDYEAVLAIVASTGSTDFSTFFVHSTSLDKRMLNPQIIIIHNLVLFIFLYFTQKPFASCSWF